MEKCIRLVTVEGFWERYSRNHEPDGVTNVRTCTLNGFYGTFEKESNEFLMFKNRVRSCMLDIPTTGTYEICVWSYSKGSLNTHISRGIATPNSTVNRLNNQNLDTIDIIINHVMSITSDWITAFEVVFYDFNPAHHWLFIVR